MGVRGSRGYLLVVSPTPPHGSNSCSTTRQQFKPVALLDDCKARIVQKLTLSRARHGQNLTQATPSGPLELDASLIGSKWSTNAPDNRGTVIATHSRVDNTPPHIPPEQGPSRITYHGNSECGSVSGITRNSPDSWEHHLRRSFSGAPRVEIPKIYLGRVTRSHALIRQTRRLVSSSRAALEPRAS